jgi:hypothetical protein
MLDLSKDILRGFSVSSIFVAIPTHDGRAVVHSLIELASLSQLLGGVRVVTGEGSNIPRTRNLLMDLIRQATPPPPNPAWVLWIDSDILLPLGTANIVAKYIDTAIKTERPWLANYFMANGQSVLMKDRTLVHARHYSREELAALPDWAEIGMGGFGFAFLPMSLDYEFHADKAGEDIHFWLDHPHLTVHFAKGIALKHRKASWV